MASNSPFFQSSGLITFDILYGGKPIKDEYQVYSVEVHKVVNKISTIEIAILPHNPSRGIFQDQSPEEFPPGKEIIVKLGYDRKNKEVFKGMCVRTGIKMEEQKHPLIVLHGVDHAFPMTVVRKSGYYFDMTDSDVMNKIIGDVNLKIGHDVESTSYKHKEMVHYHSTAWDFIMSRADANGMIVFVEDDKLQVKEPNLSGGSVLTIRSGTDIIETNLEVDARKQLTKVRCHAWDMAQQRIVDVLSDEPNVPDQGMVGPITGPNLAKHVMSGEYPLHMTGPLEEGELRLWANARLKKSRLSRIRGTVTFQGSNLVKVDELIKIEELSTFFDGNAYVSGVRHELREGMWTTEVEIGMPDEWFTAVKPNIEIDSGAGLLPGMRGVYNGVVKKIDADPDGATRILLDIPVLEEKGDGVWARMAGPYATADAGSFFIPEIDDEVVVSFLNGDPRFPVILGMLYGKSHMPPYEPDSLNKTKAIVTNTQMKIIFQEDKKNIIIETPGNNRITISDEKKKIILEDQNQNLVELSPDGIKLDTLKDIKMTAKGKILIDGMQEVSIKSVKKIKAAAMDIDHTATKKISAKGTMAEVTGSVQASLKGGIVRIN